MGAPSLYVYVDSKFALYGLLFADGYRALLEQMADLVEEPSGDPRDRLRRAAQALADAGVREPT